jgi:hypothetical protein
VSHKVTFTFENGQLLGSGNWDWIMRLAQKWAAKTPGRMQVKLGWQFEPEEPHRPVVTEEKYPA